MCAAKSIYLILLFMTLIPHLKKYLYRLRIALMLIINNAMHANKKSNFQDWEFYLRPGKSKIHIWKFFSFLFEETTPCENLLYYLDSHVTDVLSLQVLSVPLWPCWASLFYHSICVHQIFPWGICDFSPMYCLLQLMHQ